MTVESRGGAPVSLSLTHRHVGEILVEACEGRIVEGQEAGVLQQEMTTLLLDNQFIILDLARVEYIDSGGLGLLVRLLSRARGARGDLKLCAVPPRVSEILRITRLAAVFDTYATQAEAVASFYRPAKTADATKGVGTDILCVSSSADVLAYASAVLRQAGFGVMASANLPDALPLLRASRPQAVVIDAALHDARDTWTAGAFNELAAAVPVIDLPADFSSAEAGEAGQQLLDRVRAALNERSRVTGR